MSWNLKNNHMHMQVKNLTVAASREIEIEHHDESE